MNNDADEPKTPFGTDMPEALKEEPKTDNKPM